MNKLSNYIFFFFFLLFNSQLSAQTQTIPKPLYDDPVYHGAADPVIIYNKAKKKWWMLYTNRRANVPGLSGVAWVHGTRLGIAEWQGAPAALAAHRCFP